MMKAIMTAAVIASFGSAALAQGIQPVTTVSGQNSDISVGSLTQTQLIALAAVLGITVAALVAALDDSADGTN